MSLDAFFFAAEPLDAYGLDDAVIPADLLEEVSFSTADGNTVFGVWAHQAEPGAQPLIHFHGNTGHIDYYWDRVERLWSMGFETFIFDYRGYGRSAGTPSHSGVVTDGLAAVDEVRATLGVGAGDLVFNGLSMGGSVAVHVAGQVEPRALITEDMFASGEELLSQSSGGLDLPAGWFLDEPFDNVAAARQVSAPYLVMHGAEDSYVPHENGEIVYAAASDPKSLWLVPGADHAESPDVALGEYDARVWQWIDDAR